MEQEWYKLLEHIDDIQNMSDNEAKAFLESLSSDERNMVEHIISVKRAMQYQRPESSDAEITDNAWNEFSKTHKPHRIAHKITPLVHRLIAAACVLAIITGIAIAANSLGWISWDNHSTPSATETEAISQSDIVQTPVVHPDSVVTTGTTTIEIFDNVALDALLANMARHYGATLHSNSSTAAQLRIHFEWDKSLSLQRNVQLLNNFENVNISCDNQTITINDPE